MLTYDDKKHEYRWNGKIVVSVTQVTNRVGVRKTENDKFNPVSGFFQQSEDVSEISSIFGKAIHSVAQMTVLGKQFDAPPEMQPWINGLNMFWSKYWKDIHVIDTEKMRYSSIYQYAGTPDLYGMYCGHPIVIDWKSCVQISESWNYQTSGYEQLIKEETKNKKSFHRWVVQIKPDDYYIVKRHNEKQDFNRFLSILNVYKAFA